MKNIQYLSIIQVRIVDLIKWWQILLTIITLIYFILFYFYCLLILKIWLCNKVHIIWFEPISRQSINARSQPTESHLTRQNWVPDKCKERAEKRKAEQQERGQKPGIKWDCLIHTSRIITGQTERSLSMADTTELCSLSPPSHFLSTLSFTVSSCKEEWYSFLTWHFLHCMRLRLEQILNLHLEI